MRKQLSAGAALLSLILLIGCGGAGVDTGGGIKVGSSNGSTGGTGGGTTGGFLGGVLPPDTILYSTGFGAILIKSVNPDGSGIKTYAPLAQDVYSYAFNPVLKNYVFSYSPDFTGNQYLYKGASPDPEGASPLFPDPFSYIGNVQITPDGRNAVFSGTDSGGNTSIYVCNVEGGSPRVLDSGDYPALSPNGLLVAYCKDDSNGLNIYMIPLAGGTPTPISTSASTNLSPQFDRSGTRVAFTSDRSGNGFDVYTEYVNGTNIVRVTNTPTVDEFGASYNSTGTKLSCVGIDSGGVVTGLYTCPSNGSAQPTLIVNDGEIGVNTYWTDLTGRSLSRGGGLLMHKRFRR